MVERARTHSLNEAASYHQLLTVQRVIVPRFFSKYIYHIVSQAADESRDVHVLLLENVNGVSSFEVAMANDLSFPSTTKQKLVAKILDMVNTMHSHGVFHRDLAGSNILVNVFRGTRGFV